MKINNTINNTGYNVESSKQTSRVINKDGKPNIKKSGISFWNSISLYHSMLDLRISHFILICLLGFFTINFLFAAIYFLLGAEKLGIDSTLSSGYQFLDCYFFSAQTITTVGYGRISPTHISTNIAASIESVFGLMSFAVMTGLLYGRFSKPKAHLQFSKNIVIAPYKDSTAVMFRCVSTKNNNLTDLEAQLLLVKKTFKNEKWVVDYINLPLELSQIQALALNWTIVHHITPESPLYQLSKEDFETLNIEFIVFIKAFDEHFSNTVKQRSSYTYSEVLFNASFETMYSAEETYTTLHLDKLNNIRINK